MKKKVKRLLTGLLALALVFTSVDLSVLRVQAAEEAKTYNFNQLTENGNVIETVSSTGALTLTLASYSNEAKYALPDEVLANADKITNIKLNVDTTNSLAIKVYTTGWVESSVTAYWANQPNTITDAVREAGIIGIGIMNCGQGENEGSKTYNISSITVYRTDDADANGTTYDFTQFKSQNYIKSVTSEGQLDVTFNSNYSELKYALPSDVDSSKLQSIVLNKIGDVNHLGYKLYTEASGWGDKSQVVYWNDTITLTDAEREAGVLGIGIMLSVDQSQDGWESNIPKSYSFSGVTFNVTAEEVANITPAGETEDKSYTADELAEVEKTYNVSTATLNGDKWNVEFPSQYSELIMELPEAIDITQCNSITFAVSEQSGPVAFKLYTSAGELSDWTKYSQKDATLYVYDELPSEGTITRIGIAINENLTNQTAVFDGVMFDMKVPASANITPAGETEDKSYTADELAEVEKTYNVSTATLNGDKWNVEFPSQYSELIMELPEAIDITQCNSITFAVSEQSGPVAFKLYTSAGELSGWTKYSQKDATLYVYDELPSEGTITRIGIAINENLTNQTAVFDGVMFDMKVPASANITPAGETEDKSYTADELAEVEKTYNVSTATLNGDKWNVEFPSQYSELIMELPEAIDITQCNSITFAVSEQSGPVAFKLYTSAGELSGWTKYSQKDATLYVYDELPSEGTITRIGIAINENLTNQTAVFDGVMFDMKVPASANITPAGETEDKSYTADELAEVEKTYNVSTATLNGDKWNVEFPSQYSELIMELPEAIDITQCNSITFAVSEQSGPVAFKLYTSAGELSGWTKYSQKDATLYVYDELPSEGTITRIGIAINENLTNQTAVFDGVMFDMKASSTDDAEDTTLKYYTFKDEGVVRSTTSQGVTCSVSDTGVLTVKFPGEYSQITFSMPDGVDTTTLKKLSMVVAEGDTSKMGVKIYSGDVPEDFEGVIQIKYNSDTLTVSSEKAPIVAENGVKNFVIMNQVAGEATFVIPGFAVTAVQTGGSDTKPTVGDSDESGDGGEDSGSTTQPTYTFKDVTVAHAYGVETAFDENEAMTATFAAQYRQIGFTFPTELPEGKDLSMLTGVKLVGSDLTDVGIKVYTDENFPTDFSGAKVDKNATEVTFDPAEIGTPTYFSLMNYKNGEAVLVFDGFELTFADDSDDDDDTTDDEPEETTPFKYYTFSADEGVVRGTVGQGVTYEIDENGTLTVNFPGQYTQIAFTLPDGVDTKTLEELSMIVEQGTASDMALKLYTGDVPNDFEGDVQVKYNSNTLVVSDDVATTIATTGVKYFVIMNQKAGAATYVLPGFAVTAQQTGGSDTKPSTGATDGEEGGEGGSIPAAQYTFNDVTTVKTHQATLTVDETTGVGTFAFAENYGQVAFTFPDDLDTSLITSLALVGEDVSGLSLKIYADETFPEDFSGEEKAEYSSSMSINTALTGTLKYFVIMNTSGAAKTFEIAGFDTTVAEELAETYEVTLGVNDLTWLSSTEGATSNLVGDAHYLTFTTYNSDEVKFTLPEVINMEKCISMTVSVAEQVGPMNYYFYSGSTKIGSKYYYPASDTNEHVIEFNPKLTGKMDTIGIQLGGEENTANAQIKILGVTFVMEGTEPLDAPTDGIYTYSHFIDQQVSEGTEVEVDETDYSATITFAEAGDSIILPVPDAIDLNHLVSIDMIAEGAENTRIVLLDKDGDVVMSTAASTIATKCNPEIAFIKLVSTADKPITVDLTGFKFNVDPKAFESIILNGNFAREDVSMWKNALWGTVDGTEDGESTTITAKTSETELVDGIYTYGEITRRSSPYVCFAQDVSDRVEPGKGYYVGAWVKLDEEDYAGADATLRAASLGIYYLDANGKENYGLFLLGDDVMVCEPGEWTFLWCRFNLPESATGCVVRIMEQGTNYGQGDCLMGGYAVTGVTMSEAPLLPKPTGGSGGGGTNTTITKETNWVESYDMDDLLVEWASAGATKSGSSLKMTFKNNYDEARMDLPRELDAADMAYVKLMASSNVPLALKLYYKGSQVDVGYYNTIADEYILVPSYTGKVDAIGVMSLATPNPAGAWATFKGIEFGLTEEPDPIPPRTSIVLNGDFSNEDLADWKASFWGEGVTMTRKVSQNPIAPGVYNYASYSKRTSPYQCFAQDITEAVEEGKTYTFSFWARLSSAYEGAPESQRIIQFAPYTVDSDGNADYNPKLDGNYLQVCEPGVWTYFEGTYKVTNPNDVAKVVIRILEQGTNYGQGECVLGGFDIADVKMDIYVPEPPSIDEDVPNLKDALAEDFGDDFYTGTAVTLDELDDIGVEMLVNKHFNAITLGNELKPDCLFNYSNNKHTELKTVTFNGQKLEVPTLYFYRADEMLDKILEWNKTHPESPILVKGHVLVWHSQTPEWFFREGYVVGNNADGTPNYVSAEEMDLRLEWFISEVLNHYLGEDSPYKDLFYAWDVVNEAVSNGNSGYRTDKASSEDPNADTHSSNSSWWAVYQSNEYIINAFKYANKYAPANVELYYNDYNECDSGKMKGIVQLLTDVKNAEGTRIDGMGMQGHYNMFNPSVKDIEKAIRAYAAVVGKVNYSEFDMKVSGDVSSEEKLQKEYLAQAERYHDIYQLLLKLDAEEGIDISGITWWGTVDHHSWLQESSELGGGANGGMTQCPLLFDTKYKVKPSFWAFVDYTMVDPDWTPEGEETPVDDSKEDSKEESKEDVTDEGTASTEESKADTSTEKTEDTSSEPKERSVLPFALAGGAGAAIIAASAALLFRKKKN